MHEGWARKAALPLSYAEKLRSCEIIEFRFFCPFVFISLQAEISGFFNYFTASSPFREPVHTFFRARREAEPRGVREEGVEPEARKAAGFPHSAAAKPLRMRSVHA